MASAKSEWQAHLPEEIAFWDDYLRTGGLQWPDEFARRADPRAPLRRELSFGAACPGVTA